MRNEDPWKGLLPSPNDSSLVGHLVLESRPHEVFRSRDALGRRALFLVHNPVHATNASLPMMAGLDVEAMTREDGQGILVARLQRDEDADVFARFCEDIIMTIATARDEAQAVQAFIGRTWKWHAFLKGARRRTLSREAQLGLLGELYTLTRVIGPETGLGTAVEAWRGSEGAPKDFELSCLCIECKARNASSREKVRITSEHQLADVPGQEVLLLVHTFAGAANGEPGALDLHGEVRSLRLAVSSERPDLGDLLKNKLDDAGYEDAHDYDVVVIHKSTQAFRVEPEFPRIVPGGYPQGPVEVSYDLPLTSISPFEITMIAAGELIRPLESGHE